MVHRSPRSSITQPTRPLVASKRVLGGRARSSTSDSFLSRTKPGLDSIGRLLEPHQPTVLLTHKLADDDTWWLVKAERCGKVAKGVRLRLGCRQDVRSLNRYPSFDAIYYSEVSRQLTLVLPAA